MSFQTWLTSELVNRNWSAADLTRSANEAGHKISLNQISKVIKGQRKAGPDTCIAIAGGLGVPRIIVFRERGWLPPKISAETMRPELTEAFLLTEQLPQNTQISVAKAFKEIALSVMSVISHKREVEEEEEPPENPPENPKTQEITERIKAMTELYEAKKDEAGLIRALDRLNEDIDLLELAAKRK